MLQIFQILTYATNFFFVLKTACYKFSSESKKAYATNIFKF